MDKITVTTAVIGLLAVSRKMTDSYWDVDGITRDSTSAFNIALKEVKQCRSTITLLYNTLALVETGELPFPDRASSVGIDPIIAILTDLILAFSELDTICAAISERLKLPGVTMAALAGQYNQRITSLSSRIRWQSISMTTIINVLKCHGDSDAQHSRKALDLRINRLLSSNTALAARMSHVQDVYGARAFLHNSRHETPFPTTYALPNEDGSTRRFWSVFTNYSLADFPMLSVIHLPLGLGEVRDGSVFYTLDYARDVSQESDSTPPRIESPTNISITPEAQSPKDSGEKKKKNRLPIIKFRRLRRVI
ncbi:hypothetical protein LIA77_05025 [Sarocladium implicatum]|nr:hypothetical protein LIA77_05025 [Sarocladium implicatum]